MSRVINLNDAVVAQKARHTLDLNEWMKSRLKDLTVGMGLELWVTERMVEEILETVIEIP